jgi:hypothetical protein
MILSGFGRFLAPVPFFFAVMAIAVILHLRAVGHAYRGIPLAIIGFSSSLLWLIFELCWMKHPFGWIW